MELKEIDMKNIVRNPKQPRQSFDHEKIMELSNSIKEGDLLQPITVRPLKNDKYGIVCGERRFRAFEYLKAKKIPAVVREFKDDIDVMEKSAIENWHREDLTDYEKRNVINDLWKSKRYTSLRELSRKTGINVESIRNYIEEEEYRQRVDTPRNVSHTTIRATEGLDDDVRKKAIEIASEKDIPARKLEEEIIPKIKKIKDPEKQMEALELYGQESEVTEEVLDEAITRLKEEAEGTRPIMLDDGKTSDDKRLDIIKNNCSSVYSITSNKVKMIKDDDTREKAIDHIERAEKYLHTILFHLGRNKVAVIDDEQEKP